MNEHPSEWPRDLRGMVDMTIPLGSQPVLAWALNLEERVSATINAAAAEFQKCTGTDAQFAYLRQMPTGAPEFAEVGQVTVMTAAWVPSGFVVLLRGGTQLIDAEYRQWHK